MGIDSTPPPAQSPIEGAPDSTSQGPAPSQSTPVKCVASARIPEDLATAMPDRSSQGRVLIGHAANPDETSEADDQYDESSQDTTDSELATSVAGTATSSTEGQSHNKDLENDLAGEPLPGFEDEEAQASPKSAQNSKRELDRSMSSLDMLYMADEDMGPEKSDGDALADLDKADGANREVGEAARQHFTRRVKAETVNMDNYQEQIDNPDFQLSTKRKVFYSVMSKVVTVARHIDRNAWKSVGPGSKLLHPHRPKSATEDAANKNTAGKEERQDPVDLKAQMKLEKNISKVRARRHQIDHLKPQDEADLQAIQAALDKVSTKKGLSPAEVERCLVFKVGDEFIVATPVKDATIKFDHAWDRKDTKGDYNVDLTDCYEFENKAGDQIRVQFVFDGTGHGMPEKTYMKVQDSVNFGIAQLCSKLYENPPVNADKAHSQLFRGSKMSEALSYQGSTAAVVTVNQHTYALKNTTSDDSAAFSVSIENGGVVSCTSLMTKPDELTRDVTGQPGLIVTTSDGLLSALEKTMVEATMNSLNGLDEADMPSTEWQQLEAGSTDPAVYEKSDLRPKARDRVVNDNLMPFFSLLENLGCLAEDDIALVHQQFGVKETQDNLQGRGNSDPARVRENAFRGKRARSESEPDQERFFNLAELGEDQKYHLTKEGKTILENLNGALNEKLTREENEAAQKILLAIGCFDEQGKKAAQGPFGVETVKEHLEPIDMEEADRLLEDSKYATRQGGEYQLTEEGKKLLEKQKNIKNFQELVKKAGEEEVDDPENDGKKKTRPTNIMNAFVQSTSTQKALTERAFELTFPGEIDAMCLPQLTKTRMNEMERLVTDVVPTLAPGSSPEEIKSALIKEVGRKTKIAELQSRIKKLTDLRDELRESSVDHDTLITLKERELSGIKSKVEKDNKSIEYKIRNPNLSKIRGVKTLSKKEKGDLKTKEKQKEDEIESLKKQKNKKRRPKEEIKAEIKKKEKELTGHLKENLDSLEGEGLNNGFILVKKFPYNPEARVNQQALDSIAKVSEESDRRSSYISEPTIDVKLNTEQKQLVKKAEKQGFKQLRPGELRQLADIYKEQGRILLKNSGKVPGQTTKNTMRNQPTGDELVKWLVDADFVELKVSIEGANTDAYCLENVLPQRIQQELTKLSPDKQEEVAKHSEKGREILLELMMNIAKEDSKLLPVHKRDDLALCAALPANYPSVETSGKSQEPTTPESSEPQAPKASSKAESGKKAKKEIEPNLDDQTYEKVQNRQDEFGYTTKRQTVYAAVKTVKAMDSQQLKAAAATPHPPLSETALLQKTLAQLRLDKKI